MINRQLLRLGRRIAIGGAGALVIAAGVAMLVLPGPGAVTIVLGLGILGLEFKRPRVWLARMKAKGSELRTRFRKPRSQPGDGR